MHHGSCTGMWDLPGSLYATCGACQGTLPGSVAGMQGVTQILFFFCDDDDDPPSNIFTALLSTLGSTAAILQNFSYTS
jgi:hypothetical protein